MTTTTVVLVKIFKKIITIPFQTSVTNEHNHLLYCWSSQKYSFPPDFHHRPLSLFYGLLKNGENKTIKKVQLFRWLPFIIPINIIIIIGWLQQSNFLPCTLFLTHSFYLLQKKMWATFLLWKEVSSHLRKKCMCAIMEMKERKKREKEGRRRRRKNLHSHFTASAGVHFLHHFPSTSWLFGESPSKEEKTPLPASHSHKLIANWMSDCARSDFLFLFMLSKDSFSIRTNIRNKFSVCVVRQQQKTSLVSQDKLDFILKVVIISTRMHK